MLRHLGPLVASSSLVLLVGCEDPKDPGEGEDAGPTAEAGQDPEPGVDRPALTPALTADPRLAAPITVHAAIPADAAAVGVVRAPDDLFTTATQLNWFGATDAAENDALRQEIDAYLREQIGIELSAATSLTIFYAPDPDRFGLIVEGVRGELTGPVTERHGEAALRSVASTDLLAVSSGTSLLLGDKQALASMLDVLDGKRPALTTGEDGLAALLVDNSAGANFAAAARVADLPPDLAEPAAAFGVQSTYLGVGSQGLRLVALGSEADMSAAAAKISVLIATGLQELEKNKAEALAGDDVLTGVAAIAATHTAKRMAKTLEPEVDGGRLSIELPLEVADAGSLVAIMGVSAAVAIPAFTKYIRRSKTAEAKVQLAKVYDLASTYFHEEHAPREVGDLDAIALHQCPNDGRAKGESGITPPLSVNCNAGPGGRCVPAVGGGGPGYYDLELWSENAVWSALDYMQEQAHYFHYNFIWANDTTGYGGCQFTVQAFADLDDDGVFSTYERSGAGDNMGVNGSIGLYIDNEVE